MRRTLRRFAAFSLCVVAFATWPAEAEATELRRDKFLEAVNDRRDCPRDLEPTGHRLRARSVRHSRRMADAGYIFHSNLRGYEGYQMVGEVVGVSDHWVYIFEALFDSPPHRRILRDCRYDLMAVGFYRRDGALYLTARVLDP